MAKTDFTVFQNANVNDALVPGTLSGSGTNFLRITNGGGLNAQVYHAMKTGVSNLDHGVDLWMRHNVAADFAGMLVRATAVNPLTAYRFEYNHGFMKIFRYNAGVATTIIVLGESSPAGTIFQFRAMIKGNRLIFAKKVGGVFVTKIDVTDASPLGAGAPGFFGQFSAGESTDFDDFHSYQTL